MVQWMDKVDINLQNIVKEVNTLEEFEKERVVFQVCLNAIQMWYQVLQSCLAVWATGCVAAQKCDSQVAMHSERKPQGLFHDLTLFFRLPVFHVFYANVDTV